MRRSEVRRPWHPLWACGWTSIMALVVLSGCNPSQPMATGTGSETGGASDSAPSFADTVAELDKLFVTIRDGLKDGDHDAAHLALHEVYDPIKRLTSLESESNLSVDARQAVQAAAEEMAKLYNKLDEAAHDGEGHEMNYDEVSDGLAQAMDTIKSYVKQ